MSALRAPGNTKGPPGPSRPVGREGLGQRGWSGAGEDSGHGAPTGVVQLGEVAGEGSEHVAFCPGGSAVLLCAVLIVGVAGC